VGNIGTLVNLVKQANLEFCVSSNPEDVLSTPVALIAGIGSFDYGMSKLDDLGITNALRDKANDPDGKIVGICLGMQLLFEGSEEGNKAGLGILPGVSIKFPRVLNGSTLRVPHMGWSAIAKTQNQSSLTNRYESQRFYFVHSYFVEPARPEIVKYSGNYGVNFPAIIESGNVLAAQFHPEKSSKQGRALLVEMLTSDYES
jgi:glutamine amidotransferase